MSSRRTANKRKTRFKKGPEPIITRHEREGNMNYFSEEITKSIVDKIISLTITRHFLNNLNIKLPQLCFNNIKREMSKYIHCQFISHDRDDMFFFIHQPQINVLTDYIRESTYNDLADFHFDQKDEARLYDNSYDGFNYWGDVPQPTSTLKERNAATQISYARKFPIKKNLEVVPDEPLKTEENSPFSPISRASPMLRSNYPSLRLFPVPLRDSGGNERGKQKNISANFITFDLPFNKEDEVIQEDEDIEQSRKEFFDNKERFRLIEKEEADKIEMKKKKELNKEETKAQMKNNRIRKNCTNDANCKLVYIREVIPDTLKIEFNIAKSDSRDIMMNYNEDAIKDKGKDSLARNSQAFIPKIKDALDIGGLIERKNTNRDFAPSAKKLNPERFFAVKPLFGSIGAQMAKEEIIPSGSSFSLFTPEVGVSILENNQTKIGGRDYYRKYNKYSIENYNQRLRDTLHLFQTSYLQRELFPQSNSDLNSKNNQNDNSSQISNFSNNISSMFKQSSNSSSMIPNMSEKRIRSLNRLYNFTGSNSNSNSNIKLNTSARFLSLRAAIETLDLINEREEDLKNKQERRGYKKNAANLLKKLTYRTINPKQRTEKQSFDEMDTFTKKISMNALWGNDKMSQSKLTPYKPIQRKIKHINDNNDLDGELNMTRASSLPRIRIKKSFNFSAFNFTQSPLDNFTRIHLNKTKYFSKNFFKVN